MISGQQTYRLDCVFFGHTNSVAFLSIVVYWKRQINMLDNASHIFFIRIQFNGFNKCPHELLLFQIRHFTI